MFTLSHTAIINIHKDSVDMRLGVHSLQGLIAGSGYSVREGARYAFTNRSRTLLRTVWFNGTGLCMFSKRLERGVFSWPREASPGGGAWEGIQPSAFGLLLERMGLHGLTEPLACHWIRAAVDWLLPLYRAMRAELLESPALHVDETPVRRLKGTNKNGYMWGMSSAYTARTLYLWSESRAAGALDTLLREGMAPSGRAYGGAIVTDGCEGYASWLAGLEPGEPRPQWQMCWAHVRRKFVECSRSSCDPQWSAQVVEDIKPLYAIERKLREGKAPPGEILRTRKETAAQIVEKLFQKLQDKLADTANPPLNKLRDAIAYALKHRDTLKSWLETPCLPNGNNTVERAVRPVTVSRKNYLFIGAPEAGQRAAVPRRHRAAARRQLPHGGQDALPQEGREGHHRLQQHHRRPRHPSGGLRLHRERQVRHRVDHGALRRHQGQGQRHRQRPQPLV